MGEYKAEWNSQNVSIDNEIKQEEEKEEEEDEEEENFPPQIVVITRNWGGESKLVAFVLLGSATIKHDVAKETE